MTQEPVVRNTCLDGELRACNPVTRSYMELILGQVWAAEQWERCGGNIRVQGRM